MVCSAPCCRCRIHLRLVPFLSRDMHEMGGVTGAMAVVFVNARRASVAMVDEHQNAQLLTSRRTVGPSVPSRETAVATSLPSRIDQLSFTRH
jgi:hypothetical protein